VHDHRTTLEYLAWLGFDFDPQLALTLKPRREASALLCLVVGDAALTDAFLGGFLGGKRDHSQISLGHTTTTTTTSSASTPLARSSGSSRLVALGSLPDVTGTEKYLAVRVVVSRGLRGASLTHACVLCVVRRVVADVQMRKYGLEETEAVNARLHEASLVIVLYDSADSRSLSNTAHAGTELNGACRNRDTPVLHLALNHTVLFVSLPPLVSSSPSASCRVAHVVASWSRSRTGPLCRT
jgi:hypothetical protein